VLIGGFYGILDSEFIKRRRHAAIDE
jgi:hypothetical protein